MRVHQRWWMGLALPAAVLLAHPVRAADVFTADFETGTFLASQMPPGPFDSLDILDPNTDAGVSTVAAHRGTYGLRVIDTSAAKGVSEAACDVEKSFGTATESALFLRMWIRLTPWTDAGITDTVRILRIAGNTTGGSTMDTGAIEFADSGIPAVSEVDGRNAAGTVTSKEGKPWPLDGQWHLVELAAVGVGTSTGSRLFWLDGVSLVSQSPINWTGKGWNGLSIGETFNGNLSYAGTIDYDDVRASKTPQASLLLVDAGQPLTVGDCAPLTVTLATTASGEPAPAPYAFTAVMSSATLPFYSDSMCQTQSASVAFAEGASTAESWTRPSLPGIQTVSAQYVDFVSVPATLLVIAPMDGGSAEPSAYRVGCDCGQSEGRGLVLLVCVLWVWAMGSHRNRVPPDPRKSS